MKPTAPKPLAFMTPEERTAWFTEIGRRGGNRTKRRLATDPEYYARIGGQGGETMRKRGPHYYSALGRMKKGQGFPMFGSAKQ